MQKSSGYKAKEKTHIHYFSLNFTEMTDLEMT